MLQGNMMSMQNPFVLGSIWTSKHDPVMRMNTDVALVKLKLKPIPTSLSMAPKINPTKVRTKPTRFKEACFYVGSLAFDLLFYHRIFHAFTEICSAEDVQSLEELNKYQVLPSAPPKALKPILLREALEQALAIPKATDPTQIGYVSLELRLLLEPIFQSQIYRLTQDPQQRDELLDEALSEFFGGRRLHEYKLTAEAVEHTIKDTKIKFTKKLLKDLLDETKSARDTLQRLTKIITNFLRDLVRRKYAKKRAVTCVGANTSGSWSMQNLEDLILKHHKTLFDFNYPVPVFRNFLPVAAKWLQPALEDCIQICFQNKHIYADPTSNGDYNLKITKVTQADGTVQIPFYDAIDACLNTELAAIEQDLDVLQSQPALLDLPIQTLIDFLSQPDIHTGTHAFFLREPAKSGSTQQFEFLAVQPSLHQSLQPKQQRPLSAYLAYSLVLQLFLQYQGDFVFLYKQSNLTLASVKQLMGTHIQELLQCWKNEQAHLKERLCWLVSNRFHYYESTEMLSIQKVMDESDESTNSRAWELKYFISTSPQPEAIVMREAVKEQMQLLAQAVYQDLDTNMGRKSPIIRWVYNQIVVYQSEENLAVRARNKFGANGTSPGRISQLKAEIYTKIFAACVRREDLLELPMAQQPPMVQQIFLDQLRQQGKLELSIKLAAPASSTPTSC